MQSALFLTTGRVSYAVCLVSNYGQSLLSSGAGFQLRTMFTMLSSFSLNIIS